jgi:anti-sigma regulatory factor (Ser/Thr protein kinase)
VKAQQHFALDAASVPAARHFVLRQLPDVDPTVYEAVELMVSELATNAVLHAGTEFSVTVETIGDQLRVEVADDGASMPRLRRPPPPSQEHGRGLRIVRELSDKWGVDERRNKPGKAVWFQIVAVPSASG